jgi:hypothetical protein
MTRWVAAVVALAFVASGFSRTSAATATATLFEGARLIVETVA